MVRTLWFAVSAAALIACPALRAAAADDPQYVPGAWHYRSVSCVDSTVTLVTPRLGNAGQTTFTASEFEQTGVRVQFATGLGMQPLFSGASASVTHYQGDAQNHVMIAERKGDRVQVCFLGGPAPSKYCDPDTDARGRLYRVYDYRQRAQYWGTNAEHDCGGA